MNFLLPDKLTVLGFHSEQIEEHGGLVGIRDEGLLESALGHAENLIHYGGDDTDLYEVVASLAFGLAKNHPFLDGNKRTFFVVALTTLELNGQTIDAPLQMVLLTWQNLAAGELDEDALADWLRRSSVPLEDRKGDLSILD